MFEDYNWQTVGFHKRNDYAYDDADGHEEVQWGTNALLYGPQQALAYIVGLYGLTNRQAF